MLHATVMSIYSFLGDELFLASIKFLLSLPQLKLLVRQLPVNVLQGLQLLLYLLPDRTN